MIPQRCTRQALSAAIATAALVAASAALAGDLKLKRAVLGTGGVGYFEYAAEVDGAEPLQLRVRLDQVDDILKSLIVIDPAGPASITLAGKSGASEAFASLPFSESDLTSLPALMAALKGAGVSVEAPRKLSGIIVSAVTGTVKGEDKQEREFTRISLLAGAGIEQFVLEEAQGLRFDDPKIAAQVETALTALRSARDRSGRDIAIRLSAGGKRNVRLGYVAEAPVWKSAYRLSLPKGEGKARLQGWAVLENMTGTAWNDVALTLTSGSPVTFRQSLYESYYVPRETLAPPVSRLALPRTDLGQTPAQADGEADLQARARVPRATAMAQAAPAPSRANNSFQGAASLEDSAPPIASPSPGPTLGAAATSADSAENLSGASFTLTAPVTVLAGESLALPFIDNEIAAEEVGWLQAGPAPKNPWHAVRLANAGDVTLPAGSVTLYETTDAGPLFAGEAQLNILPPAQNRLIAFGEDQKITVSRETKNKGLISEIVLAKAVMTVKRLVRATTIYRLTNQDAKPRKMVIDHPRLEGTVLAGPSAASAGLSGNSWRFSRVVAPGKTELLEVSVDRVVSSGLAIGGMSRAGLGQMLAQDGPPLGEGRPGFALLLSGAGIDAAMSERLQKIGDAADALDDQRRKVAGLAAERDAIFRDQGRIRENLASAPAGSDLAKTMTQKLLAQESRIEAIDNESKVASNAMDAAQKVMEDLAGKAGREFRFNSGSTF